ncbi:MAG: 2-dehydropantoate 2-reductase [Trueperaceae bacterium]|nr:2-dehydropantoate 2-reductase [Trueperaceae bacterium]
MKIAVMGAGAVGAYFGARLLKAGHEVHFIGRGEHLRALQQRGLMVRSDLGDLQLDEVSATDDAATIGPCEAVLFTVKAQDTRSAAEQIIPLLDGDTAVVSLQNGVDNEEVLMEGLEPHHVLGGVAYIEAVIAEPGVIEHTSPFARLVFGPLAETGKPEVARADTLLAACHDADIDATLSDDILSIIWTKWLFICAFSGVTALTRQPIGRVLADDDLREVYRRALSEIAALAKARGVPLPDDIIEDRLEFSAGLHPGMKSSLQQDLARGRRLELDALNGYAKRLGAELDVDTPVNATIYAALKPYLDGTPD